MKHKIYTRNDQKKEPLTPAARALVKRAITAALDYEQFEGPAEVSVTFVDNEAIRELNRDYRGKDAPTDVLSFPLFEDDEDFDDGFVLPPDMEEDEADAPTAIGDIVISVERARAQAEEYGHSFERELAFLAVHSTLHLLGYDHVNSEEEDEEMRAHQRVIMTHIGLER